MQTDRQTGLEEGMQAGRLLEWEEWAGNRGQGWVGYTDGKGWEEWAGNMWAGI
jgi:hypothetical protein